MNRKLIGGLLALGLLIPATTLAQESVLLRLKPKSGSVFVYDSIQETSMSGIGKPTTQKSALTTTMKVLSSTTQSVQLQSTLSNIKGNAPELQALKTFKMTSSISPLYKIISAKASRGGATGTQIAKGMEMAMKMSPSFPAKPIRVNDTWSMSVDLSEMFTALGLSGVKMVGKSTLNIKITLSKIEKKGPKTLAHLRMTGTDKLTMEASKQRIGV